jgi:hypothetical protein
MQNVEVKKFPKKPGGILIINNDFIYKLFLKGKN